MTASNETVIELTKAIHSLDSTIFKAEMLLILLIVVIAASTWTLIKYYERKTGELADSLDPDLANHYYESEQIDKLLSYCDKFKKKYPNDVHLNWYLGLCNYNLGNLNEAKNYFIKVNTINPNWKKHTEGYIDEIDEVFNDVNNSVVQ